MENISLTPTNFTPQVEFDSNGILKLEGRSYPENAAAFFDPLIEFAENLESGNVVMDIYLEYINTASSKKLYNLLRKLEDNEQVEQIIVNWHYEEGDEDSIETAEIFEESLIDIKFVYSELADMTL